MLTRPWAVPKQTLRLAPFDQIMALDCSGVESAALMEAASKQNYGKSNSQSSVVGHHRRHASGGASTARDPDGDGRTSPVRPCIAA